MSAVTMVLVTANPTSTLSTQDELLWRRFTAVLATVPAALDERLREATGLNHHQFSILAMLASRPDRTLQMANVAKATDSSLSRLSHTVTKLEAAGLVTRRTCDHDRRASWAVLTDEGLAVVANASDKYDALKREVLVDRVPEHVRPQLTALLTALLPDAAAEQCSVFDADLTH